MTSRHAHDGTRWETAPIAAEPEPVPECRDLPPCLARDLRALVGTGEPAVASFTVRPEPACVTEARRFAMSLLDGWCGGGLADDVGLVVSELVTNALRHSGTPAVYTPVRTLTPNGFSPDPDGIRLRLLYNAPWLLCGIMDESPVAPRRREADFIAETGRGLHLVETFSTRWGWCGLPGGKVVWALFHSP